jgi:hypothetical protein
VPGGIHVGLHRVVPSRRSRLLALVAWLGALACAGSAVAAGGASADPAHGQPSPELDTVVSTAARGRTSRLASPKLRTHGFHDLIVAFVFAAGGPAGGERVGRVFGDGLRWSLVARGDGGGGAAEVWQAHAEHRLDGPIYAALRLGAYPASITVAAFRGPSPYVKAHVSSQGHATAPTVALPYAKGSLVWAVGHGAGERAAVVLAAGQQVVSQDFDRRSEVGGWVQRGERSSAGIARVSARSVPARWGLVAVAIASRDAAQIATGGAYESSGAGGGAGADCPPATGFAVGVEDDPVFLGQQPAMSPTQGFELAGSVFDAHVLRLNVIWGQVQLYGWAPYDRAVQMARERCWTVQMTIMPNPTYMEAGLNDALSAQHLDLGLLASFVTEIVTRYGGEVQRYAIGDEPNEGKFLEGGGSLAADMATYDHMYTVGYEAVKAVDPGAQVIAGELSGNNIIEWLENVDELPSEGIGIHPYGLPHKIAQFASLIHHPLLVTEDGVQASQPNQLEQDLQRERWAREGGATEIVFYQLSRADSSEEGTDWDTGIE